MNYSTPEDAFWTNGPSNRQIEQLSEIFKEFDNGTGYLPMTALRSFLIAVPRPVGFKAQAPVRLRKGVYLNLAAQNTQKYDH